MLTLYIVLILSLLALLGTAVAMFLRVRRHLRATAVAVEESGERREETITP